MQDKKKPKREVKGIIKCPHCNKGKVVVYENAAGNTSQVCSRCGCCYIADYDDMSAVVSAPIKGIQAK